MTRFRLSISVIATALAVAVPGVCQAAWGPPAIDRADGADAAFLDGDYEGARRAYLQLYARTGEPNYLHNVAGCYEKMGAVEQAVEYFNRYLNAARDLDAGTRAEVLRKIERLQAAHTTAPNARDPLGAPPAAPVAAPSAPLSPPPVMPYAAPSAMPGEVPAGGAIVPLTPALEREAPSAPAGVPASPEPSISGAGGAGAVHAQLPTPDRWPVPSILRAAGIAEAGAGAVALGVGLYFGMHARSLDRQVAQAKVFDAGADRDGQRAYALQYAMYALGGALIAGSAAFFYCGHLLDRDGPRVALLPSVASGGAGGVLAARF